MVARTRPHVVVIGGGIAGLSAAWFVQQSNNADYTVLEQSNVWGGKIITETVDRGDGESFVVEYGPDSFITTKPYANNLAKALGVEERIMGTNNEMRKIFVLNRGKVTKMPDGMMLIIPTKFAPFAFSPLISIPGKMRMALEMFIPTRRDDGDESLSAFVERRLGREAVDKLAEPLLSGIYNTDAEEQSIMATFPRFRKMEQEHGSLTRAMLAAQKKRRAAAKNGHSGHGGSSKGMFVSFESGMAELIDALTEQLTGDLRLNTSVTGLEADGMGGYVVTLADGETLRADAVILATPAQPAARLLNAVSPEGAAIVGDIPYVSTGTMSIAYRAADLPRPLHGFGIVIPRSEQRPINAITWTSSKLKHRAPEDYALIRVFFGGSRSPQSMQLDDDALRRVVLAEVKDMMDIDAEPLFTKVWRWRDAVPQYVVGHEERIAELDALLPPGLEVAGSAYRGSGVPDCVHSAEIAAERVLASLAERKPTA